MSDKEQKNNEHREKQSEEKLWSKQFDEEPYLDSEGIPSRKDSNKNDYRMPQKLVTIFIILILIIIVTTSAYLWWSNSRTYDRFDGEETNIQLADGDIDTKSSNNNDEQEKDASEEEESEKVEENLSEESISDEQRIEEEVQAQEEREAAAAEAEAQAQAERETQAQAEAQAEAEREAQAEAQAEEETQQDASEEEESEEMDGEYETYVVQPQDNLYRIALNHGMTTEELKALNGITTNTISVGTELRVP